MAILIDKKHYIQLRPFSAFEIYTIALEFLMERTLYRLQPKNPQPHHRPNVVNILAEARGGNEDTRLLRAYNTFLDTGNDYNTPERFKTLFTGFSFKRKSDHVDGLELADLCAYPIGKHIWDPLQSHPSYSILEPKLMKTRKRGGAEGVGIKRFPAPGAVRSLWHP